MVILVDILLAGLRFVFIVLIYLFLWQALRLMYLEFKPGRGQAYARPAGGRPVLTVLEAPKGAAKRGESHPVGEKITIGRDSGNDIVLNDIHVSAHHAMITRQGGSWQLQDLGSTNGTYVNGRLLTDPQHLWPGDQVRIGDVTFKVGWEDASRGPFPYRADTAR